MLLADTRCYNPLTDLGNKKILGLNVSLDLCIDGRNSLSEKKISA